MVFNNNSDLYDDFEESLSNLNKEDGVDRGFLGYTDEDGVFSVYSDKSRKNYRVRLDDGTNIEAQHNGKVQPAPSLPVVIKYNKLNQPYIEGVDQERVELYNINLAGQFSVGPHGHHRGSGMEFPVDLIMIDNFLPAVTADYVLSIGEAWYFYNGVKYFAGDAVDLSSITITSGYHLWVMILFDKVTETLVTIEDTQVLESVTLAKPDIEDISIPTDHIPILVIKMRSSDSKIYQGNIYSFSILSEGGANNTEFDAYADGYWSIYGYPYKFSNGYWVAKG